MSKKNTKIICGLAVVLVTLILSVILHEAGVFWNLNQTLSHGLYRAHNSLSTDIVVVAIDDKTLADPAKGGLGTLGTWDWTAFGMTVENIEKGQPKSLFLDLFFSQPMGSFSQTLSRFDNIYGYKKVAGDYSLENNQFTYHSSVEPSPLIAGQLQLGFNNLNLNPDSANTNVIYGIPLEETVGGALGQHVDLMIANDAKGEDTSKNAPIQNGQMLIAYGHVPGDWTSVSFLDVYEGKVDPSLFKNKIVLLGVTSLSPHDFYYTPIAPDTPMPGVEIHANAIETLLTGDFLRYQNGWEFAGMMAMMLLGVLAFLFLPVAAGAGVFAAELAGFPVAAQWAFNRGVILDLIWPVLGLAAAYVAALAYRNFTEFAEKRKLREAFGHYVAPEVVSQITEHPEQLGLGGERRRITAFFLDIENFTHLSEGLAPQEVVKIINLYFDALSKVIMAQGGSVDKFEGDAIMALFGAPAASTDHAEKACRAALLIQEKMKELNASSGLELHVRIGLATGEAIVGNMGSEARFDYTAMGDTVNTASRLEGANKFYKTRILATEETQASAAGAVLRAVDLVRLKGKDQAVHLYEVRGLKESVSAVELETLGKWNEALEAYRAAQWDKAEAGFKAVLLTWPGDGPAETLLTRMALLKMNTPKEWDGVWRFEEK